MEKLCKNEYERAAKVFAEGFMDDPAFSLVLQGVEEPTCLLQRYFLNYLNACKELLLYKCDEGYLCLYRYDTAFAEFEVPKPLEKLAEFQFLEKHYSENYAVLDVMAVAKESRGQGLAGKMIDFFVKYCKNEHLTPLVEVFSSEHLEMYLTRGFEIAHRHEHRGITTYILEYNK